MKESSTSIITFESIGKYNVKGIEIFSVYSAYYSNLEVYTQCEYEGVRREPFKLWKIS